MNPALRTLLIPVLALLTSCDEPTKTPDPVVIGKTLVTDWDGTAAYDWHPTGRFTVAYQMSFNAGYGDHRRDILIITDTTNNHQYLAVTGCGVSELWTETRQSGKTSHTITVEE